MNPMKRVGLVALFVVVGAFFAASPALAGKPGQSPNNNTVTRSLSPPKIDPPEPHARGKYIITNLREWPTLTVTCRRLTPMKQYHFVAVSCAGPWNVWWEIYPVTADSNGDLNAALGMGMPAFAQLENDECEVVLVER